MSCNGLPFSKFSFLSFLIDYCENNTCGADQTCITLPDKFQCICNNDDAFLVNGSCTLPGSTAEV